MLPLFFHFTFYFSIVYCWSTGNLLSFVCCCYYLLTFQFILLKFLEGWLCFLQMMTLFPFFSIYNSIGLLFVLFVLPGHIELVRFSDLLTTSSDLGIFPDLNGMLLIFKLQKCLRFLVEYIIRNRSFFLRLSIFMVINILFWCVFSLRWYIFFSPLII